jgi:predicted nucleotidyltransferase
MKHKLETIKNSIISIKKKYHEEGFEIVGIFGSYAKGTANHYSDVDIAYTLNLDIFNKKYQGGFSKLLRIDKIKIELQRLLGMKVDLVSLDTKNVSMKQNIEKDILYV